MATETKMSTDAPDHEELVDQAIELAYANSEARPSLWTWSMFRLYGCLLIGYLCACTNGFDGSVMGSVPLSFFLSSQNVTDRSLAE